MEAQAQERAKPAAWKTLLAFAIIYFVWGSTFLAIRIGVHEVPPLLFAAMRFGTAGAVLLAWTIVKRDRMPVGKQLAGILIQPDSSRAYVAATGDDNVAIIDLKTLDLVNRIAPGTGPDGMAWAVR